jgi:hypothetical protein
MTIFNMGAAEILVAIIALLAGFALVSVFTDLWSKRAPNANSAEKEPDDRNKK